MFLMLSPPELLIIVVVFLLFFGGKKVPELAKGLGEGIRNLKSSMKAGEEPEKEDKKV